jgi:hypothetical protein
MAWSTAVRGKRARGDKKVRKARISTRPQINSHHRMAAMAMKKKSKKKKAAKKKAS